ncbi:zinc finger protein 37-like [Mercenaria mercenaria]|uniref:zinc finger protein 37-like n=1 Tax=Mercenaria mercenaria TaxID=6596 RepID=UPI00234E4573|nr:zinc finger protein 37-like [Mercenaria mercenaria]XP_045168590.2 zinc finger protein 37-like [Mercenaria mercenaria]XP_045168591.2 zinc finger protein 37-like [Mercenaria mercenaria]XP_045168592.2 zinc finger protein 37-like [Mercenaria mercenaria]XP_045168593.2 zinc finger protein 37-like [Mercenaria mercenaria]XP_045168594.2 zinc finger protein 37-like [Mercenaria mercenaria]XP_045168595.2 zinc finger protein 37-like [Mercenaria mercenaria]XP_045168596.2 zinc finger protein 37-like [Me
MEEFQKETLIDSVNCDKIVSALVGESEQFEKQLSGTNVNSEPDVAAGVRASVTVHDSSNYEGVELGHTMTYPTKVKKCVNKKSSHEELSENDQSLQEDMTSEDKDANFSASNDKDANVSASDNKDVNVSTSDDVLALFPFVCGICDEKFNILVSYFMHISTHENANTLLHCCDQTDVDEGCFLFSCGICDIKYPTLCTLYQHLLETEGVTDFVFRGRVRTAHACNETSENFEIPRNSAECYRVKVKGIHTLDKGINSNISMDDVKFDIKGSLDDDNLLGNSGDDDDNLRGNSGDDDDNLRGNSGDDDDTTIINESVVGEEIETGRKYVKDLKIIERKQLKRKKRGKRKVNAKNANKTLLNECKKTKGSILAGTDRNTSLRIEGTDIPAVASNDYDNDDCYDDEKVVDGINDDGINCHEDTVEGKHTKKKRVSKNRKDQLFPCEICGAVVKHQYLKRHRSTHEERTLACDQCENVYNCKNKLRTHKKQVHTDEKKFICDKCGKSFKAWPYLKQHRQIHIKERNILCPVCPMKFKTAGVFKAHLKTHSDQKPHNCEQCGKKFKRADLLTTHKKYHMEEKPFPCPECSKTFKVKQDMKKHFKVHLPPKFFCRICGKPFVQKYNVRIHMKVHGELHEK